MFILAILVQYFIRQRSSKDYVQQISSLVLHY